MNKDKLTLALKDIMSDWKKPRLFCFLGSLIVYLLSVIISKTLFNFPYSSFFYIFMGAIIKMVIFSYLSELYSNNYYRNLAICSNIPIFFVFIVIATFEYHFFMDIVTLIMKLSIINWQFLLILVGIALCSVIPSLLIVYYRYIDRLDPFAHFTSDSIILLILYVFSKFAPNNITIKNMTIGEDIILPTILIFTLILYFLIINILLSFTKCKEIKEEVDRDYNHKLFLWKVPYLESKDTNQNEKEIKYHVHIIGILISYVVLFLSISFIIVKANEANTSLLSNLIYGITIYCFVFLIRLFLFNLTALDAKDVWVLAITSLIVIAITGMVSLLIYFDIKKSKGNILDFASISMLLWVLPKIAPTLLDNLVLQTGYFQGKKNKALIQYNALSAGANICIYIVLLILLISSRQFNKQTTVGDLFGTTLYSLGFGLLLSVSLIIFFSFILCQCKSLSDKTPIKSDQITSKVTSVETFEKNRSKINIVIPEFIINVISIIISFLILSTLYYFSKSNPDKTFEAIKLSLPIFVPTFLDKLPYFVNYYLFPQGKEINLTETANYIKSIIDLNTFSIVVVLYVWDYVKEKSLNEWIILKVVVITHTITFLLRFFVRKILSR